MQNRTDRKVPLKNPFSLKFSRNRFPVFLYSINMEMESFFHITFNLVKGTSRSNASDVFIGRTRRVVISVVHQNLNLSHSFSVVSFLLSLLKTVLLFPPCLFPNAIQYLLFKSSRRFLIYSDTTFFGWMFKLSVTTFLCYQVPAVSFQHINHLMYFISPHLS